ncbi:MAG: cytochrome c3 family protein [Pseudomonadota bacterium]
MKNCRVLLAFFLSVFLLTGNCHAQKSCVTDACHSGFQEKPVVHPDDKGCADCHLDVADNHGEGGEKPALLGDMCSSCHEEIFKHRLIHSPVTKTSCQLCHNPHEEMENKLLPATYSTSLFIGYDEDAYKLCFSCHKRDLLMFPDTSYSTGFRNGIRNLHYLHVNKANRGRSCKLCHGIHGGEQEKMMADTVFFGNWVMPVKFLKTETGGSCAPGCHQPQQYDRNARGDVRNEQSPPDENKKQDGAL